LHARHSLAAHAEIPSCNRGEDGITPESFPSIIVISLRIDGPFAPVPEPESCGLSMEKAFVNEATWLAIEKEVGSLRPGAAANNLQVINELDVHRLLWQEVSATRSTGECGAKKFA